MTDLLALAAKCEAQAKQELDEVLSGLERMNDYARREPMNAFGSRTFANIGGLYALAAALRAQEPESRL